MCTFETQEGDVEVDSEDENEAGIYVFVPGEISLCFFILTLYEKLKECAVKMVI